MQHVVDLSGNWRASLADPERRRTFSDPSTATTEADGWNDIDVPGHWQSTPAFADTDGPLLYRRRFDVDSTRTAGAKRWWLVLDGIFYQGDVWLDGHYVGDTEGYFFPHQFEVTDSITKGGEHLLAVEVSCSPQTDRTKKRNLTGSLQHSTWLDPAANPGGLWRPVRLESSGPLRIRHMRVRCIEANDERAVLALRAVVDVVDPTSGTLRTTIAPSDEPTGGIDHELHHVLAAGENRIEWTVTIDRPQLWWPHALGEAPLYDVVVEVISEGSGNDGDGAPSDRRSVRTGMRTVRLDQWIMHVNGERLFLKGTNLAPTTQAMADASPKEVAADITAAQELGMDLVRVHSHIARPELYEAADAAGMLVWQDLPLQWAYSRSVRRQANRQAREAVDLLVHHPSVAIWCAHGEPLAGGLDDVDSDSAAARSHRIRRRVGQALPSWNKSRLAPSLRRVLRSNDGSRPVVAGSGLLPHLPMLDGTDSHLWFGWEYGATTDLATVARRWPRLVRFVSEFGAQAVPNSDGFCAPDQWPDLDWDRLAGRHGLRRDLLDRVADPADFATFDEWRDATQRYQADLLRQQIETLRVLKYRPTGGFAQFMLADGHPAISQSLLDHDRQPKAAHAAVTAACRPVIVVASGLPETAIRGRGIGVDLHVVSDLRHDLADVTVEAGTSEDGGPRRWEGQIPADACTFIGRFAWTPAVTGSTSLTLRVRGADGTELASNHYVVAVA